MSEAREVRLLALGEGKKPRRARKPGRLWGTFCIFVALAFATVLGVHVAGGVRRVARGEMTMAQMLTELGAWLSGDGGQEDEQRNGAGEDDLTPTVPSDPTNKDTSGGDVLAAGREWLYDFDPTAVPVGARGLRPLDLWTMDFDQTGAPGVSWVGLGGQATDGTPLVLVIHSHATEGYVAAGVSSVPADATVGRSLQTPSSVVGAGAALVDELQRLGISVMHITERWDAEGNAGAFDRAGAAIKEILTQYPSIRCVVDLHRDVLLDEDGHVVQALTWYEGGAAAQMRIVASDSGTSPALASVLAKRLNENDAHLCRSAECVSMGEAWQYDGVCVLRVEVGTAGNTPAQAASASRALASALAESLK